MAPITVPRKTDPAPCKRCAGKGIFTYRRTHLGVPGLCFRCDGTGLESTFDRQMERVALQVYISNYEHAYL